MAFVEMSLIGAFGSMAVFTGHPHWNKSADQLLPITGPVMRYWNSLPKKTQENFAKKFNLALFAGGCLAVVGPDIAKEVAIRKVEDAERSIRRAGLKIVRGGPSGEGQPPTDNDSAVPAAPPDAFVSPLG